MVDALTHSTHPLHSSVEIIGSQSSQPTMPSPSDLHHSQWQSLPSLLEHRVLARFDQDLCTNRHDIDARAMCYGLALNWLERIKHHGAHASQPAATERMNYLSSFEGVVHSRIIHNFYRHDHASQMKEAIAEGDIIKASLAGTNSVIEAAAYKDIHLKPVLQNQVTEALPFLMLDMPDNGPAYDTFQTGLSSVKQGIITIYSDDGAHALAFAESEKDKKLIFEPNHGEFEFHQQDFKAMLNSIAELVNLPLTGVQIFEG
ncbi:YopT-type cysteine protease domain-containing protein [Vibrio mangrovi]|nr:YopT-type cysteine protease domain-containing protein [Vibrio mangrovi]SMR99211.1 Yersinia/hemophilus virulence surface antigen [Vibrio mangrovi]